MEGESGFNTSACGGLGRFRREILGLEWSPADPGVSAPHDAWRDDASL